MGVIMFNWYLIIYNWVIVPVTVWHSLGASAAKETSSASCGNQQKSTVENKYAHLKWKTKKNHMDFLILSLQFWPKNPYFRLDNFPFFSSDFPVRNFSSTNFPFSRFSWEIAMPIENSYFFQNNLHESLLTTGLDIKFLPNLLCRWPKILMQTWPRHVPLIGQRIHEDNPHWQQLEIRLPIPTTRLSRKKIDHGDVHTKKRQEK